MTRAPRRNPQVAALPRRMAALVVLALAASACDAPDTMSFDDAAAFNRGGPERSVVCHYDADADMYKPLTLPAPAVDAHLRHGDALPGDRLPDDSGVFGPACEEIPDPPPPPAWPHIVEIHAPSAAAGEYGAAGAAFGPEPTLAGTAGAVMLVNDGVGTGSDACEPLIGFAAGSIALVDRGNCTFVQKAQNAQAAGAVAMVVVNNVPGNPVTLGGSDPTIVIPSVMVSQTDGNTMKAGLPANGTVRRHP
ncbi:MAG TPA: PA domain-containing protein [Longimicrobiales bacterium]|nr:PA domain-containing protein [Longimicrobiales bacterium]